MLRLTAGQPEALAVLLGLLTALRPSDVMGLTDEHIIDGIIHTGMQKLRGKALAIPVVPTLAVALEGITGPLVARPNYRSVSHYLFKATEHMSPPWRGTGRCRHLAATWSSEAGFADDDIGVLLGHTGAKSIARRHYIRSKQTRLADPFIELRREMLEAIEARLAASIQGSKKGQSVSVSALNSHNNDTGNPLK